ncbi:MAG: SDR family oxidoreductase [Actinomycetota bacterium]|nr:SDR family oxidoreductase [Actinomycetota bacterium]
MEIEGRHVVVTGAGSGIGRALARRFAAEGAKAVVVADLNAAAAEAVGEEIGALALPTDVGREADIKALIERAVQANGPIDLFFSNAGVPGPAGGPEASDQEWQRTWEINLMAHVWAARALLPAMVQRGEGYLLSTASAAGLLTQVSAAAYSVTKAAAVSLAEWLAVNYGDAGIKVSVLCPQGVRTPMLDLALEDPVGAAPLVAGGLLDPEEVAEAVVAGIREERLLILPHPVVADHMALKATQPDRWVKGMRRLVREAKAGSAGS